MSLFKEFHLLSNQKLKQRPLPKSVPDKASKLAQTGIND